MRSQGTKMVLYLCIGGFTYLLTNLLMYVLRRILCLPDSLAVMISYALVTVCHFLLHNFITFKGSQASLREKLGGHLLVSFINYVIGVIIAIFVIRCLADNHMIATACSTSVTFLLGFTLLDRFVYQQKGKGEKEDDHS